MESRRFAAVVSIFAILALVVALPLLSGWRLPPRQVYAQGGETAVMAGSYWSTEGGRDTLVVINNPSPETEPVVLALYSARGEPLYEEALTLSPLQSTNLSVQALVGEGWFGHLAIRYRAELHFLPAQVVVVGQDEARRIDMVSSELMAENAKKTTSLLPVSWQEKPLSGELALSNVASSETISGRIHLIGREQEERFAFKLKPGEMEIVPLKLSKFGAEQMVALELETERKSALGLLFSGYVKATGSKALPLVFEEPHPLQVLSGFFSAGSALMLRTGSKQAVSGRLTVALVSDGGTGVSVASERRAVDLELSSTALLDLHALLGLEAAAAGAVRLQFDAPVSAVGQVVTPAEGSVMPLKDPAATRPYLSFPLRLTEGLNSKIRLFNPGNEEIRLSLLLYFDEERYTWPLQKLAGGEHLELDLKQARTLGLAGETGDPFPAGDVGQLKVLQWRPTAERLQVTVEWEEEASGERVVFQSCPLCPPIIDEIFFEPSFISGITGSYSPFSVTGYLSDGATTDVTFDCLYEVADQAVAGILSPGSAEFFSPGETTATASFFCESCNDFEGECLPQPQGLFTTAILHAEPDNCTVDIREETISPYDGTLPIRNPARIRTNFAPVFEAIQEPESCVVEWSIVSGSAFASILNTTISNTNTSLATVKGNSAGTITLRATAGSAFDEVDVQVVNQRNVNVRAWIVAKPDGTTPATTQTRVMNDIDAANKIWQQCGIQFNLVSVSTLPNGLLTPTAEPYTGSQLQQLLSTATRTDGMEVYYVNQIVVNNQQSAGVAPPVVGNADGIAITGIGNLRTLAHELGHVMGLTHSGTADLHLMHMTSSILKADIRVSECQTVDQTANFTTN